MPTSSRRSRRQKSTKRSSFGLARGVRPETSRLATPEALEVRALMATDLPAGFQESSFVGGFDLPTAMEFSPDGRLFVLEKAGRVRVVKDGQLLPTPFLTLAVNTEGENGLNGIAFDKDFETNGYLYLHYTHTRPDGVNANRVSRFHASNFNNDLVEAGSELVLLDNIILPTGLHSTGTMHYGADGMLYIAVGDRGATGEVQNLGTFAGKLLRINPAAYPNIIPSDNPFVNVPGARGEIYALGFRNPFTFGIHPEDGTIMVNDVGSVFWEEINLVTAGGNYGWPGVEGNTNNPNYINPIHTYPHNEIGAGAITGGVFYTGNQYPTEYQGLYFFTDFIYQTIKTLELHNHGGEFEAHVHDFADGLPSAVDLDMGPDGSIYYLTVFGGQVMKIDYVGGANRAPNAVATASPNSGDLPLTVFFSAAGSTDPDQDPLEYEWNFGDGSPPVYGMTAWHTYSTPGIFQAFVTVRDGQGGVDTSDLLAIAPGEHAPTAAIQINAPHALYHAGDTIQFSAAAFDQEDGILPPSAYKWSISFHHLDHVHPFLGPLTGSNGSFTIPTTGETSPDVWYRITLTVTDSAGLKHESYVDLHPQVVQVTIQSNIAGLGFTLDGSPHTGSYTFTGVAGIHREMGALLLQEQGIKTYGFQGWSDGGLQAHTLVTPAGNTVLTVNYAEVAGDRLSSSYFVAGLYDDVLRRKASSPELTQHVNNLVSGQPRTTVINTVWSSAEARGLLVRDAYNEVFGRLPNATELAAGIASINQYGSVHKLMSTLMGSSEYWAFDKGANNQYVAGVFQTVLKRAPSTAEMNSWLAQLGAGTTRANMALAVLNSAERYQLTIAGYYQAFLNRPLDSFAASYWLSTMQQGGATLDAVAKAILSSTEYQTKMTARPVVRAMFDNVLHRAATTAEVDLMSGYVAAGLPREGLANAISIAAERVYGLTVSAFNTLLNRQPTAGELSTWTTALQAGTSYAQMVATLVATPEFASKHPTATSVVQKLYPFILNRPADSFGLNYWVQQMGAGATAATVAQAFYGSSEYLTNIVNNAYREYLGRTPSAKESKDWLTALQRGQVTVNSFHQSVLVSDEYWTKAQPRYLVALAQQQSNASVIASLYTEVLGRAGSQAEVNAWVSQLTAGMTMGTVVNAFWSSAEHRTAQARDLYVKLLDRAPTAAELTAAAGQLMQGLSTVDLAFNLLSSAEYNAQHTSVADFVDNLYADVLGRAADPQGKSAWIAALNSGTTRANAIKIFQSTDEAWIRQVDALYVDVLGRTVDGLGASYWTGALKTGQKKIDDLGLALLGSGEYYSQHD